MVLYWRKIIENGIEINNNYNIGMFDPDPDSDFDLDFDFDWDKKFKKFNRHKLMTLC